MRANGIKPAILTRGYGRSAPEDHTLIGIGEVATIARTGDEAQILVRAGVAPLGIGKDRFATGLLVEERFKPDVIILDDGFQHWDLERSCDIVLIDATDPFADGFLREPLAAVKRADALILSRAQPGRAYSGIRKQLDGPPIHTSRVTPRSWQGWNGSGPAATFCGLGNPASFWRTLDEMKAEPLPLGLRRSPQVHAR